MDESTSEPAMALTYFLLVGGPVQCVVLRFSFFNCAFQILIMVMTF